MKLPSQVILCEVGLRDGLQNEEKILETSQKIDIGKKFINSGFKVIELGSFMNPKAVPQMADTDELFLAFSEFKDVEFRALVANVKGIERAIACGCKKVKLNVSASVKHNLANINMTPQESVSSFSEMTKLATSNGLEVSGSISMPFGSPWEGDISQEEVMSIIDAYLQVGITEISLSDASGMAMPKQVYELCVKVKEKYPEVKWWLHFHNTRGMAVANIMAAMEAGITNFDTSIAGLGGCPFIPGAAGNVASEDVVHMLDEMNINSGIDILKLLEIGKEIQNIVEHETDSYLLRAGRSKDLIK